MAKKTDTKSTPAVPITPAIPAKAVAKPKVKSKPAAAKTKKVAAKAKPAAKAAKPKAPAYTQDDVALRAYFIAEKRRAHGLPGSEHQDWIEAERQLAAESIRPKKVSKA